MHTLGNRLPTFVKIVWCCKISLLLKVVLTLTSVYAVSRIETGALSADSQGVHRNAPSLATACVCFHLLPFTMFFSFSFPCFFFLPFPLFLLFKDFHIMSAEPLTVVVSGAAGQIGYSLLPLLGNGKTRTFLFFNIYMTPLAELAEQATQQRSAWRHRMSLSRRIDL